MSYHCLLYIWILTWNTLFMNWYSFWSWLQAIIPSISIGLNQKIALPRDSYLQVGLWIHTFFVTYQRKKLLGTMDTRSRINWILYWMTSFLLLTGPHSLSRRVTLTTSLNTFGLDHLYILLWRTTITGILNLPSFTLRFLRFHWSNIVYQLVVYLFRLA